MSSTTYKNHSTQNVLLYKFVFSSKAMVVVVLSLLFSMLLQPIDRAYANEIAAVADVPVASEPVKEQTVEPEKQEAATEKVEDVSTETQTLQAIDEPDSEVNEEDASDISTDVAEEELNDEEKDSVIGVVSHVADMASSSSETVTEVAATTTNQVDRATSTVDESKATSSITVVATTTDTEKGTSTTENSSSGSDTTETTVETNDESTSIQEPDKVLTDTSVTNSNNVEDESSSSTSTDDADLSLPTVHFSDTNFYQFSKQACVSVGDGSYYCSNAETKPAAHTQDRLYADVDAHGDKEIYFRTNGSVQQLTDNQLDDDAPYYDPVSETVVWQRLLNGRYQIVSYDLNKDSEVVLTSGRVNNMEPSRVGEYTVWQRWVDDNWEIMLHDGVNEQQLTDNEYHDVAPRIRDGFVIWHALNGSKRTVEVYEIATGVFSSIDDDEGGLVENPRFVLVYDTTYENGDVITKGYDLETGSLVPLAAVPGELPEELPSPDPIEETKAFVQSKPISGRDDLEDGELSTTSSSSPEMATGTTTPALTDVDMRAPTTTTIVEEFDLVVLPFNASSSAQTTSSSSPADSVE